MRRDVSLQLLKETFADEASSKTLTQMILALRLKNAVEVFNSRGRRGELVVTTRAIRANNVQTLANSRGYTLCTANL